MRRPHTSAAWVIVLVCAATLAAQHLNSISPQPALTEAAAVASADARRCESLTGTTSFAGRDMPEIANGGKISTFGGPADTGVSASEGLALSNLPGELFLPSNDPRIAGKNFGEARRLNPDTFYIAARWPYTNSFRAQAISPNQLGNKSSYDRGFPVLLEARGKKIVAWAVDYGPHGNTTDKDFDLSPGAARALGLSSGDTLDSFSYVTDPSIGPTTCLENISKSSEPSQNTTSNSSNPSSSGTNIAPFWTTSPYCAKHFGPSGVPKVSLAPSCNGGLLVVPPKPPVPIADCGQGSVLCTIPTGCLNLVCAANGNALYDPATKICGCG